MFIQRERQLPLFRLYDPEFKWPNHERILCERVAPPLPDLEPKFVHPPSSVSAH
jgi:hypothetical protein